MILILIVCPNLDFDHNLNSEVPILIPIIILIFMCGPDPYDDPDPYSDPDPGQRS